MKEDLLHFIWKYKKLQLEDLVTSKNETVSIVDVGTHNHLAGPDFFNARICIDGQQWAGNVEIHIKSSDWYVHDHETDIKYNNVILHVVWEDDCEIFRSDNTQIPTLELKRFISDDVLNAYMNLFDKKGVGFINCEKDISQLDSFVFQNWLERLYFERLERKSNKVEELLEQSQNDWEKVLFTLLLKNFGLKINGEAFLSLAQAIDFSIMRKTQSNVLQLESLLFGLSGLLHDDCVDEYPKKLKKEYVYLRHKFNLNEEGVQRPEFFKLRPSNFPTIRLSQFANLYGLHQNLFGKVIKASSLNEIYSIFEISASPYWNNHFTFEKISEQSVKKLTKAFIDLVIMNTLIPIKFSYAEHLGHDVNEGIVQIMSDIKKEKNSIVVGFETVGVAIKSAKDSQAILQLHNEYCIKNRCLQCTVGNSLLQGNG